jgi:IS605 OrfB family transposase
MITLKKPHNINNQQFLNLINKFNNVVRYSYNRRIKDAINKSSDLEKYVKSNMLNINLDASWIKAAVKKATELQIDTKLYFGGKSNFFKKKFNKIKDFNKNVPLEIRGSSFDKGNRKASLVDGNLIFKPFKGIKYNIELKLSKNEKRMLSIIEEESKLGKNYFNIEFDSKYVYISFNEPVMETHVFKKDRYLGIDLNPNWIAISIMDNGTKEIFKELIDLRLLNKSCKNKKEYELSIISKHIISLCKQYQVEYTCLEDLNISSSNKGKGTRYNKLVNNDWNRNYFVNNLVKWLNISGIKCLKVNPFYTSFIGQIKNEKDYDSIAASKEIGYRGYLMNKGLKIYDYIDQFLSGLVTTRWKEMLPNINTFKDLYNHFKNQKKSKYSYRFLFNDVEKQNWSYFRLKSNKSMIDLIRF